MPRIATHPPANSVSDVGRRCASRAARAERRAIPLYIVDTNVVVGGLLSSETGSPTRRVLDTMLAGRLRFVGSLDLLTEYREVLLRPSIVACHGLTEAEVDEVLRL